MPRSSSSSPEVYRHTHFGTVIVVAASVGLAVALGAAALSNWHAGALAAAVLIAFVLVFFHSLTTIVEGNRLRVAFGPGLISRTIPLAEIDEATAESVGLFWGWGIRYLPGQGWMWIVSGLRAVRLDLGSGRQFRVGTDDAEGLARAIRRAKATDR